MLENRSGRARAEGRKVVSLTCLGTQALTAAAALFPYLIPTARQHRATAATAITPGGRQEVAILVPTLIWQMGLVSCSLPTSCATKWINKMLLF